MNFDPDNRFPDPQTCDKQGLLAIGGALTCKRVLQAYSQGIFPWYEPGSPPLWWSPHPRLILLPEDFKVSRSFNKSLRQSWKITLDLEFEQVIRACATCSKRVDDTWITPQMQEVYIELYHLGYAHSVEVWQDNQLAGGLYGLSLGQVFFGESMFHYVTDASKVALYYLCRYLEKRHFDLIDCQIPTSHLMSLGAKMVGRKEFYHLLNTSLEHPFQPGKWQIDD